MRHLLRPSAIQRLVRFLAKDGGTYYGDAILPAGVSDLSRTREARIITGDIFGRHQVTSQVASVSRLLSPLGPGEAGTVRCLGLNYAQHAAEAGMATPSFPILFYKPGTSLAGPADAIPVAGIAQQGDGLDYECELVAVVGREARNVSVERALDYVLGYAVGNDVSHRDWQIKKGGGQWSLGKGFDGWAPWGPGIVARELLPEGAAGLKISTKVNGETRQESSTADLIFNVAQTISFLSQGTTLLPGDVIFTGTPSGVGLGMKPPKWLKDGDVVDVSLEGVGTCSNTVKFEKDAQSKL